ncbi:Bor/Iss family lipoprotein [Pajaroellobacter abortibovis]|uniref:Uncharacterized protein n=1 Tax=Pajaroellobacter abortibovis TaxID=1882918 RepID=A0A1L6MVJ9_9BACT|nr:hypothetical protein [Pajaroellobacter abortibovis]APR99508.1 hypothetical protein BCY86_01525 [Pajaroellobacter abortibovis]
MKASFSIKPLLLSICWLSVGLGYYKTTIHSSTLSASSLIPLEYDKKWHHGFVHGLVEVSGPYNLKEICPAGWSEVETQTSSLNVLASAFTWSLYTPQAVTTCCRERQMPTKKQLPPQRPFPIPLHSQLLPFQEPNPYLTPCAQFVTLKRTGKGLYQKRG